MQRHETLNRINVWHNSKCLIDWYVELIFHIILKYMEYVRTEKSLDYETHILDSGIWTIMKKKIKILYL